MTLQTYNMSFHGKILERGFWIYVWEIKQQEQKYIYVGRTGDSSSPNAASPFNRIGRHLDFKANAKGNSLARRLKENGVNPSQSAFRMHAIGPLYPEKQNFDDHRPYRDIMATIEFELANYISSLGFKIIGKHHKGSQVKEQILSEIKSDVKKFLEKGS